MRTSFATDKQAQQLKLGDVHRAIFVPKAGLIGVMSLVHFYESEFLRLGGEIQYRTEVSKLGVAPRLPLGIPGEPYFWQEAAAVGVETTRGTILTKKTVIAAGAWLSQLLDPVGVECFVKPRKRQVFNVKADNEPLKKLLHNSEFSDAACLPFIVLPNPSVYIRPNLEAEGFGVGYADEFPRGFLLEEHPKPETDFYRNGLHPIIAKYLPQFEGAESSGGFAGLYEINTLDEQPVIFQEHNLVVVGGGSGSGIMKADAIGRIAAAVYADEEYATLFGGRKLKASALSLKQRHVEPEKLVI
jgi:glycine/D-amino acid oxidase-like deaminating enzyme